MPYLSRMQTADPRYGRRTIHFMSGPIGRLLRPRETGSTVSFINMRRQAVLSKTASLLLKPPFCEQGS